MRERARHPYRGARGGRSLLAGLLLLAGALLFFVLGPFSLRWMAGLLVLPGLFFLLWALCSRCSPGLRKRLRMGLLLALGLFLLAFAGLEGTILAGSRTELKGEPDVVVILGAQVKSWGPSVLLTDRLDAALAYLEAHPELPVVVTGGQGPDEPSTEAAAMETYLVARGLDPVRIWREEQAHNTAENLRYTGALLADKGLDRSSTRLLVVSNGFHLARVRMLAARQGLSVSTLAAPASHLPSLVQSVIREAPALVKSWLLDR